MKRREALGIALLVVAALCVPALILRKGLSDAAERQWRERPYEGSLLDFQREHIALLNEAAEVFVEKPELFRQYFDWNGDTTVTILRSEVWHGTLRHDMLTDAEWETVQQLFGEQRCVSVYYRAGLYSLPGGWLDIPVFSFGVNTTGDLSGKQLLWLPEETQPETAALALETLREDQCMEKNAYPNWYAVYRKD